MHLQAKLHLRTTVSGDRERLEKFYQENRNTFLIPRPIAEIQDAVARGRFFVIEDSGKIVAATGVFDYEKNLPYVELAETFVPPALQGFRLQRLFLQLRIASTTVIDGPSVKMTTAVDPANPTSLRNVSMQGFEKWEPIEQAYKDCPLCPNRRAERKCCCDFYILPHAKIQESIRDLLEATASGKIVRENKDGEKLPIEYSCSILSGELRLALQESV